MNQESYYELVITDVDGVLFNTEHIFRSAYRIVGEKHGIPALNEDLFVRTTGISGADTEKLFDRVLPHIPDRRMLLEEIRQLGKEMIRKDLQLLNTIAGDRFEYETNMLLAMKENDIPFDEVKIRTVYIEENKSSHFRAFRDSWRIYKLILAHFFRYTLSSILSAVIDTAGYALLTVLLRGFFLGFSLTAVSGVAARVVSSLFNFFMNKNMVFKTNVSTSKAMLKYYALALPQMAAQVLLTQGVYALLNISDTATGLRTLWYAIVMTVLYFLSYVIQQRWVFAPQKTK